MPIIRVEMFSDRTSDSFAIIFFFLLFHSSVRATFFQGFRPASFHSCWHSCFFVLQYFFHRSYGFVIILMMLQSCLAKPISASSVQNASQ